MHSQTMASARRFVVAAPTCRQPTTSRDSCALAAERGIVFKATAGLHHAVRSNGGHGFLNLLAAAVFEGEEEAALEETDPASFALDGSAFSWRERSAGEEELARARRAVVHSIGSCSFFEPIEELESLGMLTR